MMKQQQGEEPEKANEDALLAQYHSERVTMSWFSLEEANKSTAPEYKRRNHSSLLFFLSSFSTWCEEMWVDETRSLSLNSSQPSGSRVFSAFLP